MVRQWLGGWNKSASSLSNRLQPPTRPDRRRDGSRRRAWLPESLEGRVLLSGNPTVYTVDLTSTNGTGTGTTGDLVYVLGQANANTNTAGSLIEFDLSVFSSSKTITLTGPLTLSETAGPEVIDGPGANLVNLNGGGSTQVFSVNSSVTATISALTISAGSASTSGGGILNNGTLTISDSTIASNSAAVSGGGIDNAGSLSITGSTVAGNAVTNQYGTGGGIENTGTLSISNSTIAANAVSGQYGVGGGIDDEGTLTTINATVTANGVSPGGSGGGLNLGKGSATLDNTIVALNAAGSQASDIALGSLGVSIASSSTHNLIGTGGAGGLTNGTNGNLVGVTNPGLASSLANNGGPTLTIALLQGSPAIDGGSTSIPGVTVPVIDQRGVLRGPAGLHGGPTVDIGAYEASSSYLVTTATDSTDAGTLRAAIGWANLNSNANPTNLENPAANTIFFNTGGTFATDQTITLAAGLGTLALTNAGTAESIDGPGAAIVTVSGGNAVGVFSVASGVTATLSGLTVSDGATNTNGAGVLNSGNLTIQDSILSGNSASSLGGGIANLGTLTLTDSTLTGNTAELGGGLENDKGTVTINGSAIVQDSGLNNGGGIENDGGMTTVNNSEIEDNSAANDGAGINNATGTMTFTGSTIANNSAADGGGVANAATLTITNSTLAQNLATTAGGAIDNSATLTAVNDTIADNNVGASGSGAGLDASGGTATLYNTIVALNTAGSGGTATASDIALSGSGGVSSSSSNNLIGTGGTGGLSGGTNGNQVNVVNTGLGTLANNGGPTLTIALLAGSPAVDDGSSSIPGVTIPSTDQRGAFADRPGGVSTSTSAPMSPAPSTW